MIQKTINMEINYKLPKDRLDAVEGTLDGLNGAGSTETFIYTLQSIDDLVAMANDKLVEYRPIDPREVNQYISCMDTALFLRDLYIYVATNDDLLLKIKNNG